MNNKKRFVGSDVRPSQVEGRLYINASFNNTIVTITDKRGNTLDWISSGKLGFKGTRKSTPYAATITMEEGVELARRIGMQRLKVYIKGPGPGRDAALKVLGAKKNIDIISISDITPIPHNGPRPPKRRRV
jgi:small subunit ribosomal protein S11